MPAASTLSFPALNGKACRASGQAEAGEVIRIISARKASPSILLWRQGPHVKATICNYIAK
ncbi:MAG: hypothetical protein AWT59_1001 [Candidatus Gallionella acididurans]|uniref:Uncharacterized protein n=1 Tax=Candidatus Gallionella acididurans TaxID=1796491 RepID=A0A139BV26_9PROT|nr:MAG: hypothetical protein AWT59_1001 [Candidatus Gallionella acididurans]